MERLHVVTAVILNPNSRVQLQGGDTYHVGGALKWRLPKLAPKVPSNSPSTGPPAREERCRWAMGAVDRRQHRNPLGPGR